MTTLINECAKVTVQGFKENPYDAQKWYVLKAKSTF